ncbi:hypothetical protein [Pseudomonas sp. TWI929]|uniref:DUF6998 domain-containing protein n=1 Tax=Pseudomonas sp. TWI929 TaxID=3136795 RepID=UPI003207A3B6
MEHEQFLLELEMESFKEPGLFAAVSQLQAAYPGKPFTLDGRLVGDIGEVVASLAYKLTLNEGSIQRLARA